MIAPGSLSCYRLHLPFEPSAVAIPLETSRSNESALHSEPNHSLRARHTKVYYGQTVFAILDSTHFWHPLINVRRVVIGENTPVETVPLTPPRPRPRPRPRLSEPGPSSRSPALLSLISAAQIVLIRSCLLLIRYDLMICTYGPSSIVILWNPSPRLNGQLPWKVAALKDEHCGGRRHG